MWWSVGDGGIYYLAKAATPLNHTTLHYSNVIIHIVSLVHYIKEGTGHWQLNTRPGHINSPKYCYNVITRNSEPAK